MTTLGDGATAGGNGESAKEIRRGATGNGRGDGTGLRMAEAGGVGVQADDGDKDGVATLGSDSSGTLGRAWEGMRARMLGGGPRRRHDSKRSRRVAMASCWVMAVGRGASLRELAMVWRPWMILSFVDGEGMVRKACRNSTVSEMTWLLVSLLTSLKHRYESSAGPM